MTPGVTIARVAEEDLDVLLPLVRAYCDHPEVAPSDAALLAVSRALIADPVGEGIQLLAAHLAWTTAPDDHRAQAVDDRVAGPRSEWVHYDVPTGADDPSSVSAQPER